MPRPPEEAPTFLIDRSLGARDVPTALRAASARVEIHDDHFPQDAQDVVWLPAVGANGWIVLTKDNRIRRHPMELSTLMAAGVGAFMLTAKGKTGAEMGDILTKALPRMLQIIRTRARPFIATVSATSSVTVIAGGQRRAALRRKR